MTQGNARTASTGGYSGFPRNDAGFAAAANVEQSRKEYSELFSEGNNMVPPTDNVALRNRTVIAAGRQSELF